MLSAAPDSLMILRGYEEFICFKSEFQKHRLPLSVKTLFLFFFFFHVGWISILNIVILFSLETKSPEHHSPAY